MIRLAFLVTLLLINFDLAFAQLQQADAIDIIRQTIESTRKIKSMSYTMAKTERFEDKLIEQISYCKITRNPLTVYLRQKYPNDGLELLYKSGEKLLINPNGFPWFNLRLSPTGNMVRANQHHTILESGYDHVINILDHIINKYDKRVSSMVYIEKDTILEELPVWKIRLQNSMYHINDYTMQKDETVMQVARRDMLSEYWLVEQNDALKSCNDKRPGATIKRPTDYAPSMELYIDKKRFIPLIMKVYDTRGLFEQYSYSDVRLNPVFEETEFEKDYAEYGF